MSFISSVCWLKFIYPRPLLLLSPKQFMKLAVEQGTRMKAADKKRREEQAADAAASQIEADEVAEEEKKKKKKSKKKKKKN